MQRRILFLVCLAVLLLVCIVLPAAAGEEETIFFTAINNTLLDLSPETMPIKSNNMIYVPCSVFNSTDLGTYALYSRENQKAVVSDGESFLYFDMSAGNSYDSDGNIFYYAAIYQNGTAYIPAYFTATHFGFTCSYIRRDGRHMVRFVKGEVLSDDDFFEAATFLMEKSLNQYRRIHATPTPEPTVPPTPVPTAAPTPVPTVTPTAAPTVSPTAAPPAVSAVPTGIPFVPPIPIVIDRSDTTVYLHILGIGKDSEAMLTTLSSRKIPACFYATAQEVEDNGDFVRQLLGSGYRLGVRFQENPAAEYQSFSDALRNVAMDVSFLAAAEESLSPEALSAAEALGLHLSYVQQVKSDVDSILFYLSYGSNRIDLFLDGSFSDMNKLTRRLIQDKYTVMSVSEMT